MNDNSPLQLAMSELIAVERRLACLEDVLAQLQDALVAEYAAAGAQPAAARQAADRDVADAVDGNGPFPLRQAIALIGEATHGRDEAQTRWREARVSCLAA